jgi:hypothetical protein
MLRNGHSRCFAAAQHDISELMSPLSVVYLIEDEKGVFAGVLEACTMV